MKQQVFSSFRDFVKTVSNTYQSISDDEDISIIAKYDEAQEILYELSCLNYRLIFVEFEHPKYSNYNDEYIISIFENQIWCEKMKRNREYLNDDSFIIYVLDNCSSTCLKYLSDKTIYEVSIRNAEDSNSVKGTAECTCTDKECNSKHSVVNRDKNGKVKGFRKSWTSTHDGITKHESYSYYSNNAKTLEEMAKFFGIEL